MNSKGTERDLSPGDAARIDALGDEFELAWNAGNAPRIENFLSRVDNDIRPAAFRDLLKVEVELRRDRQESICAEDYLERFSTFRTEILDICHRSDVALATVAHLPSEVRSGLHVRCPHCHNPIELVPDAELQSIRCQSCGSDFSLTSDADEATRDARGIAQIGHFKLVERIGMGAFGSVWKAQDTELDRTVAIKIPRSGQLDKHQQEIFLREARSAAQLRHPNIVSVHEVGREGETLYIVSDFIRGVPLSEMIAESRLSFRETAEILMKVAIALHYAHGAGVVHRDLKPQNIMMDDAGEPHVLDFGLAKRESGEITMTLDGAILGTPAYMSPEQACGDSHQADRTTDVYSLGVIMFQMLTGELPFRGTPRMLMHKVINDDPQSPRQLDNQIPRDLETITLKCLRKEPRKRYSTAADFASDLRRVLDHQPIKAKPIGWFEHGWRWCQRNPSVVPFILSIIGTCCMIISIDKFSEAERLTGLASMPPHTANFTDTLTIGAEVARGVGRVTIAISIAFYVLSIAAPVIFRHTQVDLSPKPVQGGKVL